MRPFWIWSSRPAATHHIGSRTVTPIVQSIGLRWPGGGWIWEFPLAIDVEDNLEKEKDGASQRLPIPDPTRTVVWFLSALTLFVVVATVLTVRQRRQRPTPKSKKG